MGPYATKVLKLYLLNLHSNSTQIRPTQQRRAMHPVWNHMLLAELYRLQQQKNWLKRKHWETSGKVTICQQQYDVSPEMLSTKAANVWQLFQRKYRLWSSRLFSGWFSMMPVFMFNATLTPQTFNLVLKTQSQQTYLLICQSIQGGSKK